MCLYMVALLTAVNYAVHSSINETGFSTQPDARPDGRCDMWPSSIITYYILTRFLFPHDLCLHFYLHLVTASCLRKKKTIFTFSLSVTFTFRPKICYSRPALFH